MDIRGGIYYFRDETQVELPEWCYGYLELGAILAYASPPSRRLVLGLAVPTRAYVAALIGTGLVIDRLGERKRVGSEENHIEVLRGVKRGTPVIIHEDAKKVKGLFMGVQDNFHDGKTFIGVQVQEGNSKAGALLRWFPPNLAGSIAVIERASAKPLKLPKEAKSEELVTNQVFASYFLSLNALRTIAEESRTECIVVGQVNLLRQETVDTVLAVETDQETVDSANKSSPITRPRHLVKGCLQDVFRMQRFCRNDETYRSKIITPTGIEQNIAKGKEAPTVIFDGAMGFLKLRHLWPKSDFVAILDRTDPHYDDAVNLINQDFVNRVDEAEIQYKAPLPLGVEATSYWELR